MSPEELAQQAQAAKAAGDTRLGPYSNTDMHIAQAIDELRWLRYAVYQAAGGKPKKPHQYPRPGISGQGAKKLAPEARAYLTRLKAERAAAAAAVAVPEHIAAADRKKLGPAERAWIAEQLAAMNPPPDTGGGAPAHSADTPTTH